MIHAKQALREECFLTLCRDRRLERVGRRPATLPIFFVLTRSPAHPHPHPGCGGGKPLVGADESGRGLFLGPRRSRQVRRRRLLEGRRTGVGKECISDSYAAARLLQGGRAAGKPGSTFR